MQTLNIGLNNEQRQGVINILNGVLADLNILLIKTKKYHWDVVGPQFRALHELWEEHYEILGRSIDETAERIRMLGGYPIGTASSFLRFATLREHPGDLPNSTEMVERLMTDHETMIRNLREYVEQCSTKYGDEGDADFLTSLIQQHEEMAWMLRSFIGGQSVEAEGNVLELETVNS